MQILLFSGFQRNINTLMELLAGVIVLCVGWRFCQDVAIRDIHNKPFRQLINSGPIDGQFHDHTVARDIKDDLATPCSLCLDTYPKLTSVAHSAKEDIFPPGLDCDT